MYFKSHKEIENYFIEKNIFIAQGFAPSNDEDTNHYIYFQDEFIKFIDFITLNNINTVFYLTGQIDEDDIINDYEFQSFPVTSWEHFQKSDVYKKIDSDIEQHNNTVKKHLGELISYRFFVNFNGILVIFNEFNDDLEGADYSLSDIFNKYSDEISEFRNTVRESLEKKRIEKEKENEEKLEKLLSADSMIATLASKPSKVSYGQKLAEKNGIIVTQREITSIIDIISAKKKLKKN